MPSLWAYREKMAGTEIKSTDIIGNFLSKKNVELFAGDKKLYDDFEPMEFDMNIVTKIKIGSDMIGTDIKTKISHTELMEYGFHVTTDKDSKKYCIRFVSKGKPVLDLKKNNIKVILDIRNRKVWLEGSNAEYSKVSLVWGRGRKAKPNKIYTSISEDGEILEPDWIFLQSEVDKVIDGWCYGVTEYKEETTIEKDIAFMITKDGEIACFQNDIALPKILIIGDTGCLDENTIILTANNLKKIKDIKEGEYVYSMTDGMRVTKNRVVNKIHKGKQKVYRIHFYDKFVDATGDHHFIVLNKDDTIKEKTLDDIENGDLFPFSIGLTNIGFYPFKKVEYIGAKEVYDLQIEHNHNFMLANGLFVHNSGKTQTFVRIISQWFYKQGDCFFVIDPLSQFQKMYEGMDYKPFVNILKTVGESPKGLPINYFYLASKYVPQIKEKHCHIYPVDFFEFINKYGYFAYGVDKWKIGGTARYLREISGKLVKCKNREDVEEVVYKKFPKGKKGNQPYGGMITKLVDSFDDIFSYKFTSNFYSAKTKWKLKTPEIEIEEDPLLVSAFSGVVTLLDVNTAKNIPEGNKAGSRNILANILQKILHFKTVNEWARSKRVWICPDELDEIYKSVKNDNLTRITTDIFNQGRFQGIGFLATKQGFKGLPEDLIQNATAMIFGAIRSSDVNRKAIAKSFNLTPDQCNQLGELRKTKREIIAISKEPFAVYDTKGNKSYKTFVRGFYIPPNCKTLRRAG